MGATTDCSPRRSRGSDQEGESTSLARSSARSRESCVAKRRSFLASASCFVGNPGTRARSSGGSHETSGSSIRACLSFARIQRLDLLSSAKTDTIRGVSLSIQHADPTPISRVRSAKFEQTPHASPEPHQGSTRSSALQSGRKGFQGPENFQRLRPSSVSWKRPCVMSARTRSACSGVGAGIDASQSVGRSPNGVVDLDATHLSSLTWSELWWTRAKMMCSLPIRSTPSASTNTSFESLIFIASAGDAASSCLRPFESKGPRPELDTLPSPSRAPPPSVHDQAPT